MKTHIMSLPFSGMSDNLQLDYCNFISLDDKHHLSVGETNSQPNS